MNIGWPVPLLKKIMSQSDIAEAMAYERMEPYGEYRQDVRCGIIGSTIANVNKGKGGKAFKLSDFMPNFTKPKEKTLSDQIKEAFKIGS